MALSQIEKIALKQFRDSIEISIGAKLLEMKLFGSKARGDDRRDSDVDLLLIVSPDDWHLCDTAYKIATDVLLDTDVSISPKVISRKQYQYLQASGSAFMQNIIREGIAI